MSDLADVEAALVTLVADTIYPSGVEVASALGTSCRIYRGWPLAKALNDDLSQSVVNVSVVPDKKPGHATTRYIPRWTSVVNPPALSAVVSGTDVTFVGGVTAGLAVGVIVDGQCFSYRPGVGDSPELVAAALAGAASPVRVALVNGASVGFPGAAHLEARVVGDGIAVQEVRRQEHALRIVCWCPSSALRDSAALLIDECLAARPFIDLPDGTRARLSYGGTEVSDQSENALLYRRDLIYMAEYPTTIMVSAPAMLFADLQLNR